MDIKRSLFPFFAFLSATVGAVGFSDETKAAVSLLPQQAVCTDSFMAQMQRSSQPDSSQWIAELQKTDSNNDGFISISESSYSEDVSRLFKLMNADGDNMVSQGEAIQFTAKMILSEYVRQFRRLDIDKDQGLTFTEVARSSSDAYEVWDAIDSDGSEKWSFDEFMTWREGADGIDLKGIFKQFGMVSAQ
ncbi:hypothetical protein [Reinekea sp. G2M2-21]|uniref:hypothetical protein n=1 Tax=Reinekea sp. G2M2-21 TaxID=2788942 RepID=UPI0018AC13E4|nr:hypothetical protein [Reinekea sp. G2M2-21]